MKVYTRVVIDIESGRVLDETSYEYSGSVAQAGGGGTTKSTTQVKLDPASIALNKLRLTQEQGLQPYKNQALRSFGTFLNPGYSIGGSATGTGGGYGMPSMPTGVDPSSPLGALLKFYPGLEGATTFDPDTAGFLNKWLGVNIPSTTTGKGKKAETSYDFPVPILFDKTLSDLFFKGAGIDPVTGAGSQPTTTTTTTKKGKRSATTTSPMSYAQQIYPIYKKLTSLLGNPTSETPGTPGTTIPGTTEPPVTGGGTGAGDFSQFPGLASLRFATPEQAFQVGEAARLADTTGLENAARTTIENVVAPKLLSSLTAAGLGRSGAIGQGLGDAAAQFALPIQQYGVQARQNLANLIGQTGQQRVDFVKSLGLPSAPFFSSGSSTGTSATPGNPFNTVAQIGTGLAGAASLASAAPTIISGLSSAGSAIASGVGALASMF